MTLNSKGGVNIWLYYVLILYIIFVGILFNGMDKKDFRKKMYIIITFGLFTVLAALRSSQVGNDTSEYLRLFDSILFNKDISVYYWRYEKGYLLLNKILSLVTNNAQIILIVTSVIIMGGFARFVYKYSNNIWLSVYMFFTLGYFGSSMNTIRLNIAIVIILYSYDFLREKKAIKFIITVIIASLFHKTAIIFLLAWPITKLRFSYKTIAIAIVGSTGMYAFFPIILKGLLRFLPTYQYYLGSSYLDGNVRLASIMNFLVGLSTLIFGIITNYHNKKIKTETYIQDYKKVNDAENMLLFLLAGICITLISFNFSLLDRVSTYFFIFIIVYFPNAIKSMRDSKARLLASFIVVIIFFVYATTIQIMRPEWNVIYPYQFFW